MFFSKVFVVLAVISGLEVLAKPLIKIDVPTNPITIKTTQEVVEFLIRYGYLNVTTKDEITEEIITEAIKNVQKFAGTPQTGLVDSDTLKYIKAPRCGVPDILSTKNPKFSLLSNGWPNKEVTFSFAQLTTQMPEQLIKDKIQEALNVWAPWGGLTFTQTDDLQKTDILISFGAEHHGDSYPFDGPDGTLAHAFGATPDRPVDKLNGDVHFDDDEKWAVLTEPNDEAIDFFSTAVHELGHSLGIGHSTVKTSVMYPTYQYHQNLQLDYDDTMAMYQLYIAKPSEKTEDKSA